ncbi:MAG: hypothetical protein LBI94_06010 [Treponema sp.]|jgi:hypothetical protein|nr:hypothetical protein [Treponema sp.]
MNELEDRNSPVPARTLEKQGFAAVANLAGGIFLLALGFLGSRFPILGLILGALSLVFGLTAFFSRDSAGKKPGAILAAGGVLAILSRWGAQIFRPFAGTLLSIGAFALIALGVWNGIKFIKGLKSRG